MGFWQRIQILYMLRTDILEENITHFPIPPYLLYFICLFAHIRSLLFVWCKSIWVWKLVTQRCIDPFHTNFETWIWNFDFIIFPIFKTHHNTSRKRKKRFIVMTHNFTSHDPIFDQSIFSFNTHLFKNPEFLPICVKFMLCFINNAQVHIIKLYIYCIYGDRGSWLLRDTVRFKDLHVTSSF